MPKLFILITVAFFSLGCDLNESTTKKANTIVHKKTTLEMPVTKYMANLVEADDGEMLQCVHPESIAAMKSYCKQMGLYYRSLVHCLDKGCKKLACTANVYCRDF